MNGLILVICLVFWFISQSSKASKKKTAQKRQFSAAFDLSQRRREANRPIPEVVQTEPPPAVEGANIPFFESTEGQSLVNENVLSVEGECFCDAELEHVREEKENAASVYAGEIGREPLTDFSPKGLIQGFVMSEILVRPQQRFNRKYKPNQNRG